MGQARKTIFDKAKVRAECQRGESQESEAIQSDETKDRNKVA